MRHMVVISYDGSLFYGFQRQKDVVNVQGEIERALKVIYKEEVLVHGAGRTDRGVHAKYQVVHFDAPKRVFNLKNKLNKELRNVRVRKLKKVSLNFHARHSVKSKKYIYKIDLSGKRNSNYYLIVKNKLDIKKMKRVAKIFIGIHNFKNFVSGKRLDYNATIINIKIRKIGSTLYLSFYGVGFFRYMVRNLVGSLLQIGKNKVTELELKEMLENYEKERILPTASPNGLYLSKINYK